MIPDIHQGRRINVQINRGLFLHGNEQFYPPVPMNPTARATTENHTETKRESFQPTKISSCLCIVSLCMKSFGLWRVCMPHGVGAISFGEIVNEINGKIPDRNDEES